MKRILLTLTLLTMIMLLFVGCDLMANTHVSGGEISEELLGIWTWEDNAQFEYLFNDDGTGIRGWFGEGEQSTFLWSTRGSTLLITCQGSPSMFGTRDERWTFRITDEYSLVLVSQQSRNLAFSYIREGVLGDVHLPLVGTWLYSDDDLWTYVFYEDGTGKFGWLGWEFYMNWGVMGSRLRLQVTGMVDKYFPPNYSMVFHVVGDILVIDLGEGNVERYTRDTRVWEPDPALVDTWAWDDDRSWTYVFNPDGTGMQGFPDFMMEFDWGIYGSELRFFYQGEVFDSWLFEITGNSLRLENRIEPDVVYTYTRESALPENLDLL